MISTGDLYLQVWQQQLSLNLSPHAASQASGGSAHTGGWLRAPAQKTPARSAHARAARTKDSLQAQLAAGRSPREGRVAPTSGGRKRSERLRRERATSAHTGGWLRARAQKHLRGAQRAKACKLSLPRVGGPGVGARSVSRQNN